MADQDRIPTGGFDDIPDPNEIPVGGFDDAPEPNERQDPNAINPRTGLPFAGRVDIDDLPQAPSAQQPATTNAQLARELLGDVRAVEAASEGGTPLADLLEARDFAQSTPEQRAQRSGEQLGAALREQLPEIPVVRPLLAGTQQATLDAQGLVARATGSPERARELSAASGALQRQLPQDGFLEQELSGAGRSLTQAIAVGTGGPAAIIGTAALVATNNGLAEAERAGLSGPEAARFALTQGAIEGLVAGTFQRVGLGGIESTIGRAATRGATRGFASSGIRAVSELPEEVIIELGQATNSALSNVDPEALTPENIEETIRQTVFTTLVTAGLAESPNVVRSTLQGRSGGATPQTPSEGPQTTSANNQPQQGPQPPNETQPQAPAPPVTSDAPADSEAGPGPATPAPEERTTDPTMGRQRRQDRVLPEEVEIDRVNLRPPGAPTRPPSPQPANRGRGPLTAAQVARRSGAQRADQEALGDLLNQAEERFVLADVPVSQLDIGIDPADAAAETLDIETIRDFSTRDPETAPPIATLFSPTNPEALFVADGRNRVLAQRLRSRQGSAPDAVRAFVPASAVGSVPGVQAVDQEQVAAARNDPRPQELSVADRGRAINAAFGLPANTDRTNVPAEVEAEIEQTRQRVENFQNADDSFVTVDLPVDQVSVLIPDADSAANVVAGRRAGKDRFSIAAGSSLVRQAVANGETTVRARIPAADAAAAKLTPITPETRGSTGPNPLDSVLRPEERVAQLEAELASERAASRTDPLTGAGNRRLFDETLAERQAAVDETGQPAAVLLFDAANLKAANDVLGTEGADALLARIGRQLRTEGRTDDTQDIVATRQGGDEFALFLPMGTDEAAGRAVLQRLEDAIGTQEIIPGVSMFLAGDVVVLRPDQPSSEAFRDAEQGLSQAKARRKRELGEPTTRSEVEALIADFKNRQAAAAAEKKQGVDASPESAGPISRLAKLASDIRASSGLPNRTTPRKLRKLNRTSASKVAEAYESMEHNPQDPEVRAAYDSFKAETLAQFHALREAGFEFEAWTGEGQPYQTAEDMAQDVVENKHLWFFPTDRGFGDPSQAPPSDHPMLEIAEGTDGLTHNDVFRVVHDVFGHAMGGNDFSLLGEENAWREHSIMYPDSARGALTTETRGQASWIGFGPQGRENRDAIEDGRTDDIVFAPQKAGLLPRSMWGEPQENPTFRLDAVGAMVTATDTVPANPSARQNRRSGLSAWPDPVGRTAKRMREVAGSITAKIPNTRDFVGEALSPRFTYRRPRDWRQKVEDTQPEIIISSQRAREWSRRWGRQLKKEGFGQDPQQREQLHLDIHAVLEGREPSKPLSPEMETLVRQWREIMDTQSRRLANVLDEAGLTDQADAIRGNIGTYVKSIPMWTLDSRAAMQQFVKTFSSQFKLTPSFGSTRRDAWIVREKPRGRNRKRGRVIAKADTKEAAERIASNIDGLAVEVVPPRTQEERDAEDIHDPRFLLAAALTETVHNAEMVRLHAHVANSYAVKPPGGLNSRQVEEWAAANDLVTLPNRGRFHDLDGKFIPRRVAMDLNDVIDTPAGWSKLWQGFSRIWKKGLIVYNPATHGRNLIGNAAFFATVAGTSPANPRNWRFYGQAWSTLRDRGPQWEAAVRAGAITGDFNTAELQTIEKRMRRDGIAEPGGFFAILGWARQVDNAATDLYQAEDQIYRLAAWLKYQESLGMTQREAAEETNKWFPNFERTSKLARSLSRIPLGVPFASFPDQAARILARSASRPDTALKVASTLALPGVANMMGRVMAGVSEEEERIIRADQNFMERYFTPILPFRDSKGSPLAIDLRYIMPLANDVMPTVRRHGAINLPWFASGPAPQAFLEFFAGRDQFTGRQVENFSDRTFTAGANLLPIPSIIRDAPSRIAGSVDGTDPRSEDLAFALIGSFMGINMRRPFSSRKAVQEAAEQLVREGEGRVAERMVKLWNRNFKLDDQSRLRIETIIRRARNNE